MRIFGMFKKVKPTHVDLPSDRSIQRILVMKWSAMGDVVISSALFTDIVSNFPNAKVDLQTMSRWKGLFEHDSRFDRIHYIDVRNRKIRPAGIVKWLRFGYANRYDLIIDLQSNKLSRQLITALILMGRAPGKILGNHCLFPFTICSGKSAQIVHAYDVQRASLQAGGIKAVAQRPAIYPGPENYANAEHLMAQNGLEKDGYAILLPGSQAAGYLKRWGAERYAALAQMLHAKGLSRVVLVGGPDEVEECARITALCAADWLVNLCGKTQVLDLIPLCADARLIVGNDTGTAHVASCTATPMVVICGPTDPRRVKPVGDNVVALQAQDVDCINCYRKACDHHSCMARITPEMVLARLPAGLI